MAKEGKPCSTQLEPSSTKETRARPFRTPPDPVCYTKSILVKESQWKGIPACRSLKGKSLSTAISKLVMRLVRHFEQDERETDGAVHWNTMSSLKAFEDNGARKFSDKGLLQHIYGGSNKTRLEYCVNS